MKKQWDTKAKYSYFVVELILIKIRGHVFPKLPKITISKKKFKIEVLI